MNLFRLYIFRGVSSSPPFAAIYTSGKKWILKYESWSWWGRGGRMIEIQNIYPCNDKSTDKNRYHWTRIPVFRWAWKTWQELRRSLSLWRMWVLIIYIKYLYYIAIGKEPIIKERVFRHLIKYSIEYIAFISHLVCE